MTIVPRWNFRQPPRAANDNPPPLGLRLWRVAWLTIVSVGCIVSIMGWERL